MPTLGYDPHKKKFVGTWIGSWIGSMMNYLWLYEGELSGNVLTLEREGLAMSGEGKMGTYRDGLNLKHRDYRVFTSSILDDNGQ